MIGEIGCKIVPGGSDPRSSSKVGGASSNNNHDSFFVPSFFMKDVLE
jgi:hypothetical protein